MPESFFKNLLHQQSTEKKGNLENFLSEIFCEILNRMDSDHQREFLSEMVGIEEDYLHFKIPLAWETRVSIPVGTTWKYPDIVGYRKNRPYIVFENKIDSGFTQHQLETKIQDIEKHELLNQLEVYGQWLHKIEPSGFLVLLTQSTAPPINFLDKAKPFKFRIKNRYVTTWQKLFDFIKKSSNISLGIEINEFLEEEGLAMDNPDRLDFSVLDMWIKRANNRLTNLMTNCRDRLKQEIGDKVVSWTKEEKWMVDGSTVSNDDSLFWAWAIRKKNPYVYIAYGFHFPDHEKEKTSNWHLVLGDDYPRQPFGFVGIGTNDGGEGKNTGSKITSEEWWVSEEFQDEDKIFALSMISLDELLETENINESFQTWVKDRFAEAIISIK